MPPIDWSKPGDPLANIGSGDPLANVGSGDPLRGKRGLRQKKADFDEAAGNRARRAADRSEAAAEARSTTATPQRAAPAIKHLPSTSLPSPTLEELQARVSRADKLLAGGLPAGERLKVAKLRLLDQTGILLRQRVPNFDARMAERHAAVAGKTK